MFAKNEPLAKPLKDEPKVVFQEENQTVSKTPTSLENKPENDVELSNQGHPRAWKYNKSHPLEQVIGDVNEGVKTRNKTLNEVSFFAFFSELEPSNIDKALSDND